MGAILTVKFEITYRSTFSIDWPKLYIVQNNKIIDKQVCDGNKFSFDLKPEENNLLELNWYNKTERHTVVDKDVITQDQTFALLNIRVDNIQIENWFMTEGIYHPRYFKGFIRQQQEKRINAPLEKKIKSQLIWHFPGTFTFLEFPKNFWDWYFNLKQDKEVIKFLEKDPDRIHKFRGSLDPCEDLVKKIKQLI